MFSEIVPLLEQLPHRPRWVAKRVLAYEKPCWSAKYFSRRGKYALACLASAFLISGNSNL